MGRVVNIFQPPIVRRIKIIESANLELAYVANGRLDAYINLDDILSKFKSAVKIQTSLALGAGVPTVSSAPHSLLNGFKNLVAVCAASGYAFP